MRKLADGSGSERHAESGFVRIVDSFITLEAKIDRLSDVLEDITLPGVPAKLDDEDSLVIALRGYASSDTAEEFPDDGTSPG